MLRVFVKQVGVSLAQTGKVALRKEDKGSFEVLAYLIGLDNLGGKHNEDAVFVKTERAQVYGAKAAALVAHGHKDIFHAIRFPVYVEMGVVQNEDIVSDLSHPFGPGEVEVGHLEAFQPFLVEFFTMRHIEISNTSTKLSNFSTIEYNRGKIAQY
jgi:hypothetical protein